MDGLLFDPKLITQFLKVFYNVRTKYDMPHPEGSEAFAPGAKEAGEK